MPYGTRAGGIRMRQSVRLKSSGVLEKLKNEKFINLDEEEEKYDEIAEEKDGKNSNKILKNTPKTDKRGRPKKSTGTSDDESFHETDDEEISGSESIISENEDSIKKKVIGSVLGKKKIKRTGGYIPSLENFPGINGNLLSSASEWTEFINEQNSYIKRRNRRYRTVMLNDQKYEKELVLKVAFSPFQKLNSNATNDKALLKLVSNNRAAELSTDALIIDGKVSNINTGFSNNFICYCECSKCRKESESIILFAGSKERISVLKAKISKLSGISSIVEVATVLPPNSKHFKSICTQNHVLSVSSNAALYFIDCENFHGQENFTIILNESNQVVSDLSCHSWRGKHIAVGTVSGKLLVFNCLMEEIFQMSITSGSAIYSLDWTDEFTIVVGGNFSKIFSIDLRDPFLIETEASTLATLPKVMWSESLNSILFSDGENHARRLEKNNRSLLHQPIGTFDSMVHEMASSPVHNITASACASGSVHLAWMPDEPGYGVEFEKRIYSLNMIEDGSFESILKPEYVAFQMHDTIKLYPSNQACISVAWCPNQNFPGLLAAGYRNGLLVLMTTDRFFI